MRHISTSSSRRIDASDSPCSHPAGFERLFGADFHGTLITDRLASYDGQSEDDRQLCWAHLKRDFQGFADRPEPSVRAFGERGLDVVKVLFKDWRAFRDGHGDRDRLHRRLGPARKRLVKILVSGAETGHDRIVGFCNHLIQRGGALWTFIDVDGVEPTNNVAYAARGISDAIPRPGLCRVGRRSRRNRA
jgi:transposase